MMLINQIKNIYPSLTDKDFSLSAGTIHIQNNSDGKGDYIALWNHPTLARPTKEQLEAIE